MTLPRRSSLPPRNLRVKPPLSLEADQFSRQIDQQIEDAVKNLELVTIASMIPIKKEFKKPPKVMASHTLMKSITSSSNAPPANTSTAEQTPLVSELPVVHRNSYSGILSNAQPSDPESRYVSSKSTSPKNKTNKDKSTKRRRRGRPSLKTGASSKKLRRKLNKKRKAMGDCNTSTKERKLEFVPPLPPNKDNEMDSDDGIGSDSSVDADGNRIRRRRNKIPLNALITLRKYFSEHLQFPYPSDHDKMRLSQQTGLTVKQVSHWFTNCRKRYWQPYLKGTAAKRSQ